MKKKGLCILLTVMMTVGILGGCGKKEATENISLITASADEGYVANEVEEAVTRYASENDLIYEDHRVTGGEEEDIIAEIEKAAKAGTDVVVCSGAVFELPIYKMQSQYKNVKFIIVDGAPRKAEGEKYKVRTNTRAILYAQEQGGFLAGYAAVKDGYKNLGFMGGVSDEGVVRYGIGFVQGANYAAKEMNLSSDKIVIRYSYLGTNEISPSLMETAGEWYDQGCEVIFAGGGSIGTAVMKAAEQKDKKVIGADCDQSKESETVLASVIKEISETTFISVRSVFDKEFEGKKAETMDVASGGISLEMKTSRFAAFTEKDYTAIVSKLAEGNIDILVKDIEELTGDKEIIKNVTVNVE